MGLEGRVYFKLLGDGAQPPKQIYPGDAGWDLYVSRDIVIPALSFVDVHTDISIAMPRGIWAMITGRSSTMRSYGLRVENGIIDNGYRGEMFVGVWNNRDTSVHVERGSRIAQLIFFPGAVMSWEQVEMLPAGNRGGNGFGHTGR